MGLWLLASQRLASTPIRLAHLDRGFIPAAWGEGGEGQAGGEGGEGGGCVHLSFRFFLSMMIAASLVVACHFRFVDGRLAVAPFVQCFLATLLSLFLRLRLRASVCSLIGLCVYFYGFHAFSIRVSVSAHHPSLAFVVYSCPLYDAFEVV